MMKEKIRSVSNRPRTSETVQNSLEQGQPEAKSLKEFRRSFLNSDEFPNQPFALLDQNHKPVIKDGKPLTISVSRQDRTLMFNIGSIETTYSGLIGTLESVAPEVAFAAPRTPENQITLESRGKNNLESILARLGSIDPTRAIVIQTSSSEQGEAVRDALFDLNIFPAGTEQTLIIGSVKDIAKLQALTSHIFSKKSNESKLDLPSAPSEGREKTDPETIREIGRDISSIKKESIGSKPDLPSESSKKKEKTDSEIEKEIGRDIRSIKLVKKQQEWLSDPKTRAELRRALNNPHTSFSSFVSAAGHTKGIKDTGENDGSFYNTFYRFIERKFGPFYEGGKDKFLEYLEYVEEDPRRLYLKRKETEVPEPPQPPPPPKYSSLSELGKEFAERTQRPDRLERSYDYEGTEGGMRFLRYYSIYRRKFETDTKFDSRRYGPGGGISPQIVQRRLPEELMGKVTIPALRLEESKKLRREMNEVDPSYNTEDGFIRWLQDHGYTDIQLQPAFQAVPGRIREQMTQWKQMGLSLEKAVEIRDVFKSIDDSYNTPDGLIRFIEEHDFSDIHPQIFRGIIPTEIKRRMTAWYSRGPGLNYEDVPEIARKFAENIQKPHRSEHPEKYSFYDGGALFLRYYARYREDDGTFYGKGVKTHMPEELRRKVIFSDIEYQVWRDIRSKLKNIDDSYNTPDGQIRWLEENGFADVGPNRFWTAVPENIREKMTAWRQLPYSSENAKEFFRLSQRVKSSFQENHWDDPSAELRIARFLVSGGLVGEEADETLNAAFKHADALMTDLAIAQVIQPEQKEFRIANMHQLYGFAADRFELSPASVWIIMRLKRINMTGIRGLVTKGERSAPRDISLQQHLGDDDEKPTLENRLGAEDPGFEQAEARLVLRTIIRENHLTVEQTQLLQRVVDGDDLEDEEYEGLAEVIRRHPELMEMLDQERIFENISTSNRETFSVRSSTGTSNPEVSSRLRESDVLGSPNWKEGLARTVRPGIRTGNLDLQRTYQMYQEGAYIPYQDSLDFVRGAYPLDSQNPQRPFAKELRIELADKLGLETAGDLSRIKFYSALNSPLDRYHGIDALMVYDDPAVGEIIVTLDETNNPTKLEGYKADVIVYTTVIDPAEDEKVFLSLIDFWSQQILDKINEKIQERLSKKS